MALVLLPCDLPTWPTLQRHLNALKRDVRNGAQLKEALLKIYNLCSTNLEPDDESMPDQSVFDALCDRMIGDEDGQQENWMSEQEKREFFDVQLPTMADYALQLKSLKPVRGLHYSLQQQSDRVEIDRRLAASLVAHAFFSTFPRRTVKTHPTLVDFNLAGHFFHHLHRRPQRAKLRAILQYFKRLSERPPEGHVTFCRQVMSGREWCTLDDWLQCRRPLCPLVVRHDGRVEQPGTGPAEQGTLNGSGKTAQINGAHQKGIRVCFASRRLGATFLEDGTSQELPATSMCLIDAEDYSDLPVRQYEEDNVLRELNKAYLAFRQHYPETARTQQQQQAPVVQSKQRLPPVGASRDSMSSESSDPAWKPDSNDHGKSDERNDWIRSTTLVASSGDPSSPRPSICQSSASTMSQDTQQGLHQDTVDGRGGRDYRSGSGSHPTMLYGGGRNVPLTLTNATVVKQLVTPPTPKTSSPPMEASDAFLRAGALFVMNENRPKVGSVYASCHSQDGEERAASLDDPNSSTDEFRSANTSLDDDDSKPAVSCPEPVAHRPEMTQQQSVESDTSSGNRAGSLGFALEGNGNRLEEDSFSGDGLEREKRWLECFRERRGGARSNSRSGQKDSPFSSRDSSRYSFSTEFSSELDELYDQFSHWLEDPGGNGENNGRNTAVFRFAHSLLKRALSDSFASVALNIENLPDKKMKDIKLSSSAGSSSDAASEEILQQRRKSNQRSWSLADRTGNERLALQLAKEMVEREAPEEQVLPMPDIVPLVPVGAGEEDPEPEVSDESSKKKQKKLACQLNEQALQSNQPNQANQPHSPHAERVVLLDRMSPIESVDLLENHRETGNASEDEKTACDKSGEDSDSRAGTVTPMNPTPPRTRRGSWFFKKSREQRHHPSIKHQRARSNSVPTVMELAQLQLFQQRMAATSLIPDIIVSGENTEDDECFTSPLPTPPPTANTTSPLLTVNNRRHRSYDDKLQSLDQSSESLLSDDVVEGFSWTLAETIIEDIMKEIGTKQAPNHAIPHPVTGYKRNSSPNESYQKSGLHSPGALTNKKPGKSILKISSSDSLNRSHSGSLVEQPIDEDGDEPKTPTTTRPRLPPVLKTLAQQIADQHQNQSSSMSWSQRSTSMPSLCAVDECDPSGTMIFAQAPIGELENRGQANENESLPLITGNWGCGSSCGGDAQLKSMLQWMAASRAGAPCVIYHTAGAPSVVKLDIVCRVIMDRQWTVSDLASAVLRYCRCRLDPCRLISRLSEAEHDQQSAAAVWSSRAMHPHHGTNSLSLPEDVPPVVPILTADRQLFDELLGQYPLKQTEL